MRVEISPSKINGTVVAPQSKSLTHRAIICAALANGESVITNANICDDTLATIYAMRELGARIDVIGSKLVVKGMEFKKHDEDVRLVVDSSASTLRFTLPMATHLFNNAIIKVNKDLIKRPLTVYEKMYKEKGFEIKKVKSPKINRIFASGDIDDKTYTIDASESSQYVSGLLFMLPLLDHNSKIELTGEIVSRSYIDLTLEVMAKFGVKAKFEGNIITIKGKQTYKAKKYVVEGDWSLASYYLALGACCGKVTVSGLNPNSTQLDSAFLGILKKMCADIVVEGKKVTTTKSNLMATDLDLGDNVDLAMPFSFVNAFALGGSRISNASRLETKECDRKKAIIEMFKKFNMRASCDKDNIYIAPSEPQIQAKEVVSTYKDHRMAMLAVLLTAASQTKVILDDAEALNKSYPRFLIDMKKLGVKYKVLD